MACLPFLRSGVPMGRRKLKLEELYERGRDEDCWPWLGPITKHGYGRKSRCNIGAHRLVWERERGPIPEGLFIDHICRNRRCVNPSHLRPVTPRINCIENSTSLAALNFAKTHCDRGHEFTPQNTIVSGRSRRCRACARIKVRIRDRLRKPQARWWRYVSEPLAELMELQSPDEQHEAMEALSRELRQVVAEKVAKMTGRQE